MTLLTIRLPDKLKRQMKKLRHVNWSQIVRRAIEERVALEISEQRKDGARIRDASRAIDELFQNITERYGMIPYDSAETVRAWRETRYSSSSRTPQ